MVKQEVNNSNSFNIYYIIFLTYFIPRFLEYTTFIQYEFIANIFDKLKILSYVFILFFAMCIYWKKKYILPKFLVMLCIGFMYFAYQGFFENEKAIFVIFIFSMSFDIKYFDKFIRRTYYISVCLYLVTVLSCILGLINNVSVELNKLNLDLIRNSVGFIYPGQLVMSLMPIVFMYYYLNRERINLKINLAWIIINIVVYSISKTTMGFGIIMLFILVFNFFRKKRLKIGYKKILIIYSPYFFFIITIFLLWLKKSGSKVGEVLDKIVNGRLNLGNIFIDMFGVKWFGTDFVNSTDVYYQILDSEYMYMMVAAGIIYTVIALKLMEIMIAYHIKEKCLCMIWILIYMNAIVNNGVFNYVFNPFCIILVPAIREYIIGKKKQIINKVEY